MKKKIFALLICLIIMFCAVPFLVTAQSIPDTRQCARLDDSADLLSDSEEEALLWLLDSESEKNQFDFVIHTTNSIGNTKIENYADDYFDYNGFGYGENGDGAVLVIAMDIREYYISTCGRGIGLFSDEAIDYCESAFVPELSSGNYYQAFSEYLTAAADIVENGFNYTYNNSDFNYNYDYNYDYGYDDYYYNEFGITEKIVVSIIFGFVIAIIIACTQAAKLKSVRSQRSAVNYVKENSFRLSQQSDRFLYRNVTKRRKPKQTSGSGGSGGVRTGSSGRSHGGGGGRF